MPDREIKSYQNKIWNQKVQLFMSFYLEIETFAFVAIRSMLEGGRPSEDQQTGKVGICLETSNCHGKVRELLISLNIFFGVTCPFWLSLLFLFFFFHPVGHLIQLVFR
jgi:hypothetical protein